MVDRIGDPVMTSTPLLVDTPLGPVGLGLTRPPGEPRTAVLLLPGGGRRVGPNRLWPRLAGTLAEGGSVVARVDLPGHGDSDLVSSSGRNDLEVVRHATRWFAGDTAGLGLTVVCGCYGSRLVSAVRDETRVQRVGLIVPSLRARYPRESAARLRGRVARALVRRRPGVLDKKVVGALARLSEESPIWMLMGQHDVATRYAGAVRRAARDPSRVTIEVIEGAAIHTHSSPQTQKMTIDRVAGWVGQQVDERMVR